MRNKLLAIQFLSVFLSLLALTGCQTKGPALEGAFDSAPVSGIIFDQDNRPCSNVIITLQEDRYAKSDVTGRFVFLTVPPGDYSIVFEKEGYETIAVPFPFYSRTQVLYVKMTSLDQLISLAETAIEDRKWRKAEEYLARADIIDPEDPLVLYVKGVLAFRIGDTEAAIALLKLLVAAPYPEPVALLSLADIYQYELQDSEKAMEYLQRFIGIQGDSQAEQRLRDLKRSSGDE